MAGRKYRFRKMYFICTDKKVISSNTHMTNAYQYFEQQPAFAGIERVTHIRNGMIKTHECQKILLKDFIPEALFDEILKRFIDESSA